MTVTNHVYTFTISGVPAQTAQEIALTALAKASDAYVHIKGLSILVEQAETPDPACPRCGSANLNADRTRNPLSRKDNETCVCWSCEMAEALEDSISGDPWPTYPEPITAMGEEG